MKRILLTVEYDGTSFAGWQRQLNGLAVQEVLENALTIACHHPVKVTGSSRTDAGVHARMQMVHFDTDCTIPPEKYPFILNCLLPDDISVMKSREVPSAFHARFLTSGKTYTYRILNSRQPSALKRRFCWHVPVPLLVDRMAEAVADLRGKHDFRAFQASGGSAKTTLRTINRAEISKSNHDITITISGNAFLYNMVRIIAGTLVEIGHLKRSPSSFRSAFQSGSRLDLGMTAPPCGLELTEVNYPDEAFINLNGG